MSESSPSVTSPSSPSPPPSDTPSDALKWGDASLLARRVIETRVEAHKQDLAKQGTEDHVPPLVTIALERLTYDGATTEHIPTAILESHIWSWHMMPYLVLYRSLIRLSHQGLYATWGTFHDTNHLEMFGDARIDEWILRNEKWLRARDHERWQHGMVTLTDAEVVFPNSVLSESCRTVTRPDHLPGFKILTEARERQIIIQPSTEAFKATFDILSDGLLKNLDWNNVIVAGGMVLGALVTVDHSQRLQNRWALSDIDIYIHGLSASEANAKIIHIFDVFRSNLPPQMRTLAVRNSKTITFYAGFPIRRVQVVLKLAKSPRSVLLNFDLDICAMGWDGREVWMLPRAARAIESVHSSSGCLCRGLTEFWNSWIQHIYHVLDRRSSFVPASGKSTSAVFVLLSVHDGTDFFEGSIFKYADKGSGIRILPTYISFLTGFAVPENEDMLPLNVPFLAEEARKWTRERREFVTTELGSNRFTRSHLYRHESRNSWAFHSFTSLMCHVAFWEMAQSFEDTIMESSEGASTLYEDTYDDFMLKLEYKWNQDFNHSSFRSHIIQSNMTDVDAWFYTDFHGRLQRYGIECGDQLNDAQRMTFASHVEDLLENVNEIRMPVLVPVDFATYANGLVNEALTCAGLPETTVLEPVAEGVDLLENPERQEGLFMWIIGPHLMWQHLDRRIDEVFEVLYAFRRANLPLNEDLQLQRFTAELGRRKTCAAQDEFHAFAQWMCRRP